MLTIFANQIEKTMRIVGLFLKAPTFLATFQV